MTDNQFPILADGLFDGGLAADVAPKDLRAAVNVLSAASRPGSEAELATMAARVRQFSAEINAAANTPVRQAFDQVSNPTFHPTTIPTTAFVDARRPYDAHMSADTLRSNPMFATRITRKAFSIVAITLLAAGTAAAAAGGALPMFENDESNEVVVANHDNNDVSVADDGTHQSDSPESDGDQTSEPGIVVIHADNTNGDVDHHGKCTAWTNGSAKDATNASFDELQVAADAAGLTIDEYCANLLGSTDSDENGSGNSGSGNGNSDNENGNSDNGNGNSDNGNGNSDNENGNSGSGNGNSDNENGNSSGSGNGNSDNENGNSGSGNGNSGSEGGHSGRASSGSGLED